MEYALAHTAGLLHQNKCSLCEYGLRTMVFTSFVYLVRRNNQASFLEILCHISLLRP